MTANADPLSASVVSYLRTAANADGGYGYFVGKASRVEPTSWAILALLDAGNGRDDDARVDAALARVAAWQRADGLVSDLRSGPENLAFNGLAAIALQRALAGRKGVTGDTKRVLQNLLAGIVETRGVLLKRPASSRQDSQLTGWPWIEDTYSWVEPTSWCLLALKKSASLSTPAGAAGRIADAERLLMDRCGVSGGWTVGTTNVLGNELIPYVPTTALALLALQNRSALPEVSRSVAWLAGNWSRERSGLALSLALIAMRIHGRAAEDLDQAIRIHTSVAGLPASVSSAALLLYALTGSRHGYAALRL